MRFRDPGAVSSPTLPAMLAAIEAQPEARHWVDLGGRQRCVPAVGAQTLEGDMGVMTHFAHALVRGDVVADCNGPAVHVSTNRPDLPPGRQNKRESFRRPLSPRSYKTLSATARRYRFGFLMTYSRDSNYQMFVVVALSRWWYLMQVGAQPPGGAVPGPDDTVAVVVSGLQGGSGQKEHPNGSSKDFIRNTVALLAAALPFKVEVVPQDSELFFDHLWLPGMGAQNYLPCVLKPPGAPRSSAASRAGGGVGVASAVSDVYRELAAQSLAAFERGRAAGEVSESRLAELRALQSERVYIGRADVMKLKLVRPPPHWS